ncbi:MULTISPECIES: YkvI family membrane protein [Priestia]|uniref:YkvI family membrane protein n=1 Tax=Priestia TaxID=2800373 RepID=UPI001C8E9798|nr:MULTISPECIES: hypothetical protein [Priestia]MBY0063536.1 hypothetical protein [Priestia aryabhattai]MDN3365345.1 hypothetical protein [Priestia megaterium]WKU23775.1 hypothetical protein Q3A90_02630 [Priestia megaterium]
MWRAGCKWIFLIMGTMIGAGYASGRELWQFFGEESGLAIFLFSIIFAISCNVIMQISYRYRTNQFYPVLIELIGKRWAAAYDVLIVFYLFTTTVIMIAGGGATLEMWHVPYWWGIGALSALIVFVFSRGLNGLLSINSFVMPILMIGLAGVLLTFILRHPVANDWHLQHNWPAAFTFTALNILPLVAVLSTIGKEIKSKKEIYIASVGSGFLLGGLSFIYNESLIQVSGLLSSYEIPLFAILKDFPYIMLFLMSIVLLIAIYTTAVSGILGLTARFHTEKVQSLWKLAACWLLLMIPFTKLGFSTLIAVLYPMYGIVNLFLVTAVLLYPFRNRYKSS